MAIGSAPQEATEIEAFQKQRAEQRLKHLHGVVWPDGHVSEHVVIPPKKGDVGQRFGDTPINYFNGEVAITRRYKAKGCRLLADVMVEDLGREAGVKAFAHWRDAIRNRGKVAILDPDKLMPPSVLKRRRESDTGVSEDMVFIAGEGLVPATPEIKAARMREILGSSELPTPTPEEIATAKKARA